MDKSLTKPNCRKAIVLVTVLWVVLTLTIIVTVVVRTSMLDTRLTLVTSDQVRGKWAIRAGIESAIAVLKNDDFESDSKDDDWAGGSEYLEEIDLDSCTLNVTVVDESGKLNINFMSKKQLLELPYMTEQIANCILDWRDKNEDVGLGGAESGYYLNLSKPYRIRNAPFKTVKELLRVKGVTDELFYGTLDMDEIDADQIDEDDDIAMEMGWKDYLTCYSYESPKDHEGEDKININSASQRQLRSSLGLSRNNAKWITENRGKGLGSASALITGDSGMAPKKPKDRSQPQALDAQTVLQIADKIKFSDAGPMPPKVNLNTTFKAALTVLFEGDEEIATELIEFRDSQLDGIVSLEGLAQMDGLTKDKAKKIIDRITVRSNIFSIRSEALMKASNAKCQGLAVVNRGVSPVEILYFCNGVSN